MKKEKKNQQIYFFATYEIDICLNVFFYLFCLFWIFLTLFLIQFHSYYCHPSQTLEMLWIVYLSGIYLCRKYFFFLADTRTLFYIACKAKISPKKTSVEIPSSCLICVSGTFPAMHTSFYLRPCIFIIRSSSNMDLLISAVLEM